MNALLQACRTALARDPHSRGQIPALYGFGGDEPLLLLASPPEFPARILVKPPRQSSEITGWSLARSEGEPPLARQEVRFPADPLPLSLHAGHYSVVVNIGDKVQRRVWFARLGNDELSLWWCRTVPQRHRPTRRRCVLSRMAAAHSSSRCSAFPCKSRGCAMANAGTASVSLSFP